MQSQCELERLAKDYTTGCSIPGRCINFSVRYSFQTDSCFGPPIQREPGPFLLQSGRDVKLNPHLHLEQMLTRAVVTYLRLYECQTCGA